MFRGYPGRMRPRQQKIRVLSKKQNYKSIKKIANININKPNSLQHSRLCNKIRADSLSLGLSILLLMCFVQALLLYNN